MKFEHLEDYIEYMAGHRTSDGLPFDDWWGIVKSPLSLANYDVEMISSLAHQVAGGTALTDRQELLARQLCVTYSRQLRKHGVPPPPANIPCKLSRRVVNRDRLLSVEGKDLKLRFPFSFDLIDEIRRDSSSWDGRCAWNKEDRNWVIGPTEHNIVGAVKFCKEHAICVTDEVRDLAASIEAEMKMDFAIRLVRTDGGFAIENAAPELIDYVETVLGGFAPGNFHTLVDNAASIGVTLSNEILEEITIEYGISVVNFLSAKISSCALAEFNLSELMRWRATHSVGPVVIYDPVHALSDKYLTIDGYRVQRLDKSGVPDPTADIIFTTDVLNIECPSPWTLVTCFSMMYNPSRTVWTERAHRIIRVGHIR